MRSRRAPRPLGPVVDALAERLRPVTGLSAVQAVWAQAVGPAIAREASPVAERAGTVTVACSSAVWAQEIELMAPELCAAVNARLGSEQVQGLRCSAAGRRRR
jgi:predicted nucleic acid-binding Zn ribbon protein